MHLIVGISSSQDETRGFSEQLNITSISMSVATNVHVTTFVCDLWGSRCWLQRDSIITFRVCKHDLKNVRLLFQNWFYARNLQRTIF